MKRPTVDWGVVCLLILAGLLLLSNLGNGYLWQDEAETALLARHTLEFGYPTAVGPSRFPLSRTSMPLGSDAAGLPCRPSTSS